MQRFYDELIKKKPKELSKEISEMTYLYPNPATGEPTVVPASHYEEIIGAYKEEVVAESVKLSFLNTIYTQLKALKDEEPKYFQQALFCLDMNLKPSDLKINEKNALDKTQEMLEGKEKTLKKNYHILNEDYIKYFEETRDNLQEQAKILSGEDVENNNTEQSIEDEYDDIDIEDGMY